MKLFNKTKSVLKTSAIFATVLMTTLVGGGAFLSNAVYAENLSFNVNTDCDDFAVIRCGATTTNQLINRYNNGTTGNSAASIHHIYSFFGISSNDIQAIGTTAVAGRVNANGDIFINGKSTAVATDAITAARLNIAGSTKRTVNGTTFYTRPVATSLQADKASFVVMKNGVFQYAILASCGNPMMATPKKPAPTPTPTPTPTPQTPNMTVNKEVAVKGSATFAKDVTVDAGQHVVYRVTIASTGTAPVTNLVASDTLPAHVTYVANTLTRDGVAVASGETFFTSGVTVASLAAGASTFFQFEAVVGADQTAANACVEGTLTNTAHTAATSLPAGSSTANVQEKCVTTPICTNLDIVKGDNRLVTISQFSYNSSGATFQQAVVNWGDNTSTGAITDTNAVIGQKHTYQNDQGGTVSVAITFMQANGQPVVVTGVNCQKPVSFTPAPVVTPAVTVLPNTGAGSVFGMFAAVSAIGTVAYRWFLGRRLNAEA